jgi:hypothetical protein
MSPVTNRVDPSALPDLLARASRSTLAWVHPGGLGLSPARVAVRDGRTFVAVDADGAGPAAGTPASLVRDDGWSWFALRAVTLRGTLAACADPPDAAGGWLELVPQRVTAWDYGALREEGDA